MTSLFLVSKKAGPNWIAFSAAMTLSVIGLVTMNSFTGQDPLFLRQVLWILIGTAVFFIASMTDWRFMRREGVAAAVFVLTVAPLILLIFFGGVFQGARSWFDLGAFALQPVEFVKLGLIIVLAKYFSRRHIEIRDTKHILISGAYALFVFVLVALQPDFGSAIIIFFIWLGMVLCSGLSRTHLFLLLTVGSVAFVGLWFFGFQDYQKERILTFIHPLSDIHGAGYNAYQSTIAVGSGELLGKGIGYGTQSKLRFLPEYQTDFAFAAFAEEWGFVGIIIVFFLFGILFWYILHTAARGISNFETLFALGVLTYFVAHFFVHVGINVGLLPVTGTTIPFMSYGGSHILAEFLALGMLSGMDKHSRVARLDSDNEWSGGYDR